jgi:hypothetical protein
MPAESPVLVVATTGMESSAAMTGLETATPAAERTAEGLAVLPKATGILFAFRAVPSVL